MTVPFQKPATNYSEQIALLKERGMAFQDEAAACFYLEHLNYYRLGAYWLPFEADHQTHQFKPGTSFEAVLKLYSFDRELRLLMMDAIERVEVSVRSHWAYEMAHRHGPHSHLNPALAYNEIRWEKNLADLKKEVNRADEIFLHHMKRKYEETLPAVWAVCEVMSLGLLSKWYGNLKPMPTRRSIAAAYNLDEAVLGSWLHTLTVIRNICAHHARLWNREFKRTPMVPARKPSNLADEFQMRSRKLYNTLVILLYWMDIISPGHHWRQRLLQLLNDNPSCLLPMDFPTDWQTRNIWRVAA